MRSLRGHFVALVLACLGACTERLEPQPAMILPNDALSPLVVAEEPLPVPPEEGARVLASIGEVQIRRLGQKTWTQVAPGQVLRKDDTVRTAANARIDLSVDDITVRVHEDSELLLQTVERNSLRAQALGRVEGEVQQGKGRIEISGRGSDAVMRSDGGRFAMTADGRGVVAVAAVKGSVRLSSAKGVVTIEEGRQSRVLPNRAPEKPVQSIAKVLLKVDWPEKETRQKAVPVAGRVTPGSRVVVQGQVAEVKPDGRFFVRVNLMQGRQTVEVTATDVWGRKSTQEAKLLRDDRLELGVRERPAWSP